MDVLLVVGARPQFVKASITIRALRAAGISARLIHTGQHYDEEMSKAFFSELMLPAPIADLGIGSGSHAFQTSGMLERLEPLLLSERPDWVVVFGDTNSTLAAVLAASKVHFPIAHVEAGLRSGNRRMPEEVNRIVADHLSDVLLAPTDAAVANLVREGLDDRVISQVGDVMFDAALAFRDEAEKRSGILEQVGLRGAGFTLATVHRAENTDNPSRLRAIVGALAALSDEMPVVWPLHPRTRTALSALKADVGHVIVANPVGFLDMIQLERCAELIVTDSGGVQKEAFFHSVPCVTMRTETEWPELVELGWNHLVDPKDSERVLQAFLTARGTRGRAGAPYGDGHAADRIALVLTDASETLR